MECGEGKARMMGWHGWTAEIGRGDMHRTDVRVSTEYVTAARSESRRSVEKRRQMTSVCNPWSVGLSRCGPGALIHWTMGHVSRPDRCDSGGDERGAGLGWILPPTTSTARHWASFMSLCPPSLSTQEINTHILTSRNNCRTIDACQRGSDSVLFGCSADNSDIGRERERERRKRRRRKHGELQLCIRPPQAASVI